MKIDQIKNLSILIFFSLSFVFAITISINTVAAEDTVQTNMDSISVDDTNADSMGNGSAEGLLIQSDDPNYRPKDGDFRVTITKINGKKVEYSSYHIKNGEKITIEAKLEQYDGLFKEWIFQGWRHLSFYFTSYDGSIVYWKKENVLTGLFTGKASVTLDTSKLNLPNGSNYAFRIIYPSYTPAKDFEQIVLEPRNSQYPPGQPEDEDNNNPKHNHPINAAMIPMQDTGPPIGLAILAIFAVIGGTLSNKKK
ncbi:MAG: hypothetical protein LLF83_07515 [Methanobacterium sp.]|nr:hypothetical protein [Methanobacterium sp.]